MEPTPILHADGKWRCPWPGLDPLYVAYHDEEWGVPCYDSRALFEGLMLEGFQAGLSWITILRKRERFRAVFDGFRPEAIARYGTEKVAALMADAGIVRNRAKIEGAIISARLWLEVEEKQGFTRYIWSFVDGKPLQNRLASMREVQAATPVAERLSKDLKQRGFKFVGPSIVYAFMQAEGLVNDHLTGCFRHAECAALGQTGHPG